MVVRCGHVPAVHCAEERQRLGGAVCGIAHNVRVNGQVRPDVLKNLGRVDQLDVDGLRRLAAGSADTSADPDGKADGLDGAAGEAVGAGPLEVVDFRPFVACWLLGGLWWRIGVDNPLLELLGGAGSPPM